MISSRWVTVAAALLSTTLATRALAVTTINFDPTSSPGGNLPASINAMGNSPGSAVPVDAQLSNQYSSLGVLFSSSSPYVAVVAGPGVGGTNGLGGVTSNNLLSYADPVTITFVAPGTSTPGVTENVSIQADPSGIPGQFATLSAFDINGNLLDADTLEDIGSEIWTINMSGIHSVRFNFPTTSAGALTTGSPFGGGTGIALDNLTFGPVTSSSGSTSVPVAVPLHGMLWSSLAVLGSLGILHAMRRRTPAV